MSDRQDFSLQQIKERAIKKLLDIHEDSEDGAILLFRNGDEISASVVNLSNADIIDVMIKLQKQMEVE